jgi:prepilin-type N-terminal cleavage/methylation domain-containing protein
LKVLWHDQCWTVAAVRAGSLPCAGFSRWDMARFPQSGLVIRHGKCAHCFAIRNPSGLEAAPGRKPQSAIRNLRRAFTILEMLVVITIIGFMAAVALPHLPGMTQANSMTTALQQMLADCSLARQLAMSHRATVYMVFVPPNFSQYGEPVNETNSYNSLLARQYGAYALVSLRSVGDQPGQANPQYLTEWKSLPAGVFIAPWKFTNSSAVIVFSTNTLTGATSRFNIASFPDNIPFRFPGVDATNSSGPFTAPLPYIGFNPLGQLTTNGDEYIPLDRGEVQYLTNTIPARPIETPPGNAVNNCNLIHIDWLTARAKIERNQQR